MGNTFCNKVIYNCFVHFNFHFNSHFSSLLLYAIFYFYQKA